MSAYDRQYDYGMRGFRQTTRPMRSFSDRAGYDRAFGRRYDAGYDAGYARGIDSWSARGPEMPRHVTARYNLDYVVGNRGDPYPRNYNMYAGDRMQRNGDSRYFREPYITHSGTRTYRGSSFPTGYDYPDYGPSYGGRYPDEL